MVLEEEKKTTNKKHLYICCKAVMSAHRLYFPALTCVRPACDLEKHCGAILGSSAEVSERGEGSGNVCEWECVCMCALIRLPTHCQP